jgi:hypothetical protein
MIVPNRTEPSPRSSRTFFGLAIRVAGVSTVILGIYFLLVSESPIQGLDQRLSWMIPAGVFGWIVAVGFFAAGVAVRGGEEVAETRGPAAGALMNARRAQGRHRSREGWIASTRLGIEKKFPSVFQLEWTLPLLRSLDGATFVKLGAAYFRKIGFHAIQVDGAVSGIDLWLYQEEDTTPMGIVECLLWGDAVVGARVVEKFHEVMVAEGLGHGVMIATGSFSEESRTFATGKALELISGEEFLAKLAALPEMTSQQLLHQVASGELRSS